MSIAPDVLFHIAGFPVTDTVITTLITDAILILITIFVARSISLKPKGLQNGVEMVVDYICELSEETAGPKSSFIYPWVVTFFLFIVVSNLVAQLPGFESLRFLSGGEYPANLPFLRAATSDLNTTLALATVSVVATCYLGVKHLGIKSYLAKFISFKMFPIFMFVGLLEFVNELTHFISFSFRLLGNIYAGERTLTEMYHMFPFALPLPFMALELMVAVIQALVFAMLTMAFMHIATDKADH